jgi:hypothetical protein
MDVPRDFSELLALFNAHRVDYLIIGAHALAFHGARATPVTSTFSFVPTLTTLNALFGHSMSLVSAHSV